MYKSVSSVQNFSELENKLLKEWEEKGIIKKYLQKNSNVEKTFSFLDGPITANNPMGVHHAWGRTYKDVWQKYNNLQGKKQRFQSGFDCQGLWVEVEVEKELGLRSKKEIENLVPGDKKASIARFVQLCKDRVHTYSQIQTNQSRRLGYFMDWDNSYFTMSDQNNYMIWHFLKVCYENGWIYKGHESVPWCPRCETAISQHEMLTEDYKEVTHESVYLEFAIRERDKEFLLVWTTTPWTIPANIAVAVDVDIDYSLVEGESGLLFWIAKERVEAVFGKKYKTIRKTTKGKELVGLRYSAPFDDLPVVSETAKRNPDTFHTVIATDKLIMPISTVEGTGLVHTAVSAGTEDFKLGKKYSLPMIPVIADNADYLSGLGFLSGKNAKKHPRLILDYLEKEDAKGRNCVFLIEKYKHRYPACWRCKAELVWKVADEWYIAMDRQSKKKPFGTFRERMIKVAKQIRWIPGFGLERELDWLKNMHDWLISKKNRYWGLALPIFECEACKLFEVLGSKEELEERAVAGWEQFKGKSPHKPYIDDVHISCPTCSGHMKRIDDVGNPWLDAGIVAYSTIQKANKGAPLYLSNRTEWEEWFPADFITESFPGQFKNWFYALIAMSTALEDKPPFKTVLGFATCTGEDGRAMHKSWGNYIEFNEGAERIGVDVMRWLYARQNPAENLLFGYKKADEVRRQFYLMCWNIYKFFVEYANLDKYSTYDTNLSEALSSPNILDTWALFRLKEYAEKAFNGYESYVLYDVAQESERFISDISTWYIRRSRARVWVNASNQEDTRFFYKTMHSILSIFSIIVSPVLPFITEEIYKNITNKESVHLSEWPKLDFDADAGLIADMSLVRRIAEAGHRERKNLKIKVRQPLLSAVVKLSSGNAFLLSANEEKYKILLQDELNVKSISFVKTKKDDISVTFDTVLTEALLQEGKIREVIRSLQEMRKSKKVRTDERVGVLIPSEYLPWKDQIAQKVLAKTITEGDELTIVQE